MTEFNTIGSALYFLVFNFQCQFMFFFFQAVSDLKELLGKPLKTKDGKTVTITDASMTLPELDIVTPGKAAVNHPPSSVSEPQHVSAV